MDREINSNVETDKVLAWPEVGAPRLRLDWPISVVLGGGGVRGFAHLGVLEVLVESGVQIREMVGTSVGALIIAFYAAVGLNLPAIVSAGRDLKSRHLLAWALLRRAPVRFRRRIARAAGEIPQFIERIEQARFAPLHHSVERIGIVAYDVLSGELITCHSDAPVLRLEDAVRGSVAIPGLFPAWKCTSQGRKYELRDGGVVGCLPVDVALRPPFRPAQLLAVDISGRARDRQANLRKISSLRIQHPGLPIHVICAETLGEATIAYGSGDSGKLLDIGRRSAAAYLAQLPSQGAPMSVR